QLPADAGINWTIGAVRRFAGARDLRDDLGAGAEAGIEQAARFEPRERGAIIVHVLGLAAHRLLPGEAEPGEGLEDRRLEFRPAARAVDVLDAEQETAAGAGGSRGEQRRVCVAEMQIPGRAGRETGDLGHGP